MAISLSQNSIMQVLDWAYDKAVSGGAGLDSASELAAGYLKQDGSRFAQVNSLIRWQNTKAGTSGFLTGLGGISTLPVAIPANISSVIFIQIRMIAAIAHMGGHPLDDDRVRTLVYACLAGNGAKDILKDMGIVLGCKLTESVIKNISGKTITAINQKVGFRLLTKFGEKGVLNLGKAIPLVGGVVGASFDSVATNAIGNIARNTFIPADPVAAGATDDARQAARRWIALGPARATDADERPVWKFQSAKAFVLKSRILTMRARNGHALRGAFRRSLDFIRMKS